MKEIWINLELYFKRYDFYNFRDFFWIFPDFSDLNFYLKTIKNIKNNKKGGRVDATWHARPRGSATRTRAARPRGAIYIILYYIYIYKWVFVLPYMGRVIPVVTVGSYKPDGFEITLRVGLIHKFYFLISGDVAHTGPLDRLRHRGSRASIA